MKLGKTVCCINGSDERKSRGWEGSLKIKAHHKSIHGALEVSQSQKNTWFKLWMCLSLLFRSPLTALPQQQYLQHVSENDAHHVRHARSQKGSAVNLPVRQNCNQKAVNTLKWSRIGHFLDQHGMFWRNKSLISLAAWFIVWKLQDKLLFFVLNKIYTGGENKLSALGSKPQILYWVFSYAKYKNKQNNWLLIYCWWRAYSS